MATQTGSASCRTAPELLAQYDVLVVGGGYPGVCAAVAAARAGAQVAMVERDGTLGGQAAEIYTFGLDGFVDRDGGLYAAGVPWEILRRTVAEGQSDPLWDRVDYERMARDGLKDEVARLDPGGEKWDAVHLANATYVDPHAFRYVLFQIAEEEGIDLYLETPLCDTLVSDGVVEGVVAVGNYRRFALGAGVVVDTTPQAAVAAFAGKVYPFADVYTGTHPRVAGVETQALTEYILAHPDDVEMQLIGRPDRRVMERLTRERVPLLMHGFRRLRDRAVAEDPVYETTGRGDPPGLTFFSEQDGCGTYWVHSAPVRVTKFDDVQRFSHAIAYLRKQQWLTHRLFREFVPGFERAHLVDTHPHIARAGFTAADWEGFSEYDIPWAHMEEGGEYYADSVARVMGHPNMGQSARGFQVPLRALIPKGLEHLLIIGKPACRVFHYHGTHAALGQAAAVVAAVAARESADLRGLDVCLAQAELRRQGAIVT